MAILTKRTRGLTKRVLVYGPPKVGKSQLVSSLAAKHKLLWIDLENGHDVLYKLPEEHQANINLIAIPDSNSNPVAIDTVTKLFKGAAGRICHLHGKLNCAECAKQPGYQDVSDEIDMAQQRKDNHYIVVVDSLTQLRASALAVIAQAGGSTFSMTQNMKTYKPYKNEFDDWAKLNALVEMTLSEVQAATYDVVIISHEDEVEQVDGTPKIVAVSGTRNSSRNTGKYFSDIVYCDVRNGKHVAASGTTYRNNIQTGSRSDIKLEDNKTGDATLLPFFEHRPAIS